MLLLCCNCHLRNIITQSGFIVFVFLDELFINYYTSKFSKKKIQSSVKALYPSTLGNVSLIKSTDFLNTELF